MQRAIEESGTRRGRRERNPSRVVSVEGEKPEKPPKRKLIEVALPLEAINRESAREKSIRHGHPSTLHLWWARRPLAAARAVLFAQLVDDPSSHPDRFPTEEAQQQERKRLHGIIERLVVWENTRDQALLHEAHQEILNSTNGNPPPILDPFAGGGTIPLEAQRLGLEAHANDLNPLPILLNTVTLDLTSRFDLTSPVSGGFPGPQSEMIAEDLRYFAERLAKAAASRAGDLYPPLEDGSHPLVYLWARVVTCPNPACTARVPLAGSWKLSDRRGKEAYLEPAFVDVTGRFQFSVKSGTPTAAGNMRRNGATCMACGTAISLAYIKAEGVSGRLSSQLVAIQAQREGKRRFVEVDDHQVSSANTHHEVASDFLEEALSTHSQYMAPPRYGLTHFRDLFSNRQLAGLGAFLESLGDIEEVARQTALAAGLEDDETNFSEGGRGARAYGQAMRILLALAVGRLVNRQSTLCMWDAGRQTVQQVFARQAYSMTWLYAEANPFGGGSGSFDGQVEFLARAIAALPGGAGKVQGAPAQHLQADSGVVVSTDPPYYDNVPYADLSDFFLVWHRQMLKATLPIFPTVLSPKSAELVADHVRHGGKAEAKAFFEDGFEQVFRRLAQVHRRDVPMTVYYAFKQTDVDLVDGDASTGWETLLEALMSSGWSIHGTWPMRTELAGGLRALGRNALASSVVVVCRKAETNSLTDRAGFIAALRSKLPRRLRELQQGAVAPVDLQQSAIGPGMAVFSTFARVLEDDGSAMSVRSALRRINDIVDEVLNEQEGDFDDTTRFAIAWYRHKGYDQGRFGDADNMARARNTSVGAMARDGILESVAGDVTLLAPDGCEEGYDPIVDDRISAWEVLHHLIASLDRGGITEAGALLSRAEERDDGAIDPELLKELAFLLFSVAEKNGWTNDAINFNKIATAWPEIVAEAGTASAVSGTQEAFDLEGNG